MKNNKLLIANRGEIAVRIIQAAKALGLPTVAVCSEADSDALPARMADESIIIGPPGAGQSYLDQQRGIDAAKQAGQFDTGTLEVWLQAHLSQLNTEGTAHG
ncbi:biotin carboxylase N-terminal domain-containing protein [Vibrio quintilis]|uniref:Biotin carboxylase n=1 Tax=Vibrio quintilis TaxID=1117707 RepID=A0A1M7YT86_9VIBR|nr:biotin carboxylase N-terminal domain-containing protein [Vibrio quintilis]SHO55746.1 Biotin carboxylase [Vibrio quintilis]